MRRRTRRSFRLSGRRTPQDPAELREPNKESSAAAHWMIAAIGLVHAAYGTKLALAGGEIGGRGMPAQFHGPDPIGWAIAATGLTFALLAVRLIPSRKRG